ncbi:MAG: hypothetical protein ETSY2_39635 [Candidatus Entotheonella gemina]|uniref:Uncharacterized protein n=1 Tax=Candidatus Entotheonella gemina TaxID=1429439 RepID=W4LQ80_9BACT|nr:MAG: hypothetical protein ETSY2_39635 [Candidatus Entotheonella gemina]
MGDGNALTRMARAALMPVLKLVDKLVILAHFLAGNSSTS